MWSLSVLFFLNLLLLQGILELHPGAINSIPSKSQLEIGIPLHLVDISFAHWFNIIIIISFVFRKMLMFLAWACTLISFYLMLLKFSYIPLGFLCTFFCVFFYFVLSFFYHVALLKFLLNHVATEFIEVRRNFKAPFRDPNISMLCDAKCNTYTNISNTKFCLWIAHYNNLV